MAHHRAVFSCALFASLVMPVAMFGPSRAGVVASRATPTPPPALAAAAEPGQDVASGMAPVQANAASPSATNTRAASEAGGAPAAVEPAAALVEASPSAGAPPVASVPAAPVASAPAPLPTATAAASAAPSPAAPVAIAQAGHLLDENQMVVYYGSPLAAGLGILGTFEPEEAARRVQQQAQTYDDANGDRGAIGALDVIYALAQDEPTQNGLYVRYLEDDIVQRYIDLADQYDLQVILDLQIGRGDIAGEVRKIERFLRHPRVHVAIDPEYAVGPWGEPIVTPGYMSGHDINAVQEYVAALVETHSLPPKMVVIHQYMDETITEGEVTRLTPQVHLVLNMDAFGEDKAKRKKYRAFASRPYAQKDSFNIFLKQDERVLSEEEVLDLKPEPDVVFYQ